MYPLTNILLPKAKSSSFYVFVFFTCIQVSTIEAFSFYQYSDSTEVIFLSPSDDCFVQGGVYADMNFDSLYSLKIKANEEEQHNRQAYLKFDVSALQGYDIDTAILRLTFNSGADSTIHALRLVDDDNWQEDSLTWNNKPSINSLIHTAVVHPSFGSEIEFELTEAIRSEVDGDGILSLNISEADSTGSYIAYFSSEYNLVAYHPYIEVIYRENCADGFEEFALTEFPQNLQLYGRDTATNQAIVEVIGEVGACGDSVSLVIWRDGLPFAQYGAKPDTSAAFTFYPEITAELAQYTFELYEITATDTRLRASAADVVAGDVYIINGQSNAEAQQFGGSSAPDANPFIRVHGYGSNPNDTLWHIAQGDGDRTSQGNTGQWGLYFAKQIIDNQGIPIAIFNGARGGWRMQVFRRHDPEPETPNNYGQLLARLNRTKLADKARAILWYQGEEDVIVTTPTNYKRYFTEVYDDWMVDYPSLEQIYLAEIRTGCFSQPNEAVLIQNALRQLAEELPKTSILSTKGLLQHGDCHFEYEGGYKELGRRFYRLIERDLYGATTAVVESPNISTAAFTAPNQITLTMQATDTLTWESGSENDFTLEGDSLTTVISGYADGNTIVLQLSTDSTAATGITYLDKSGIGVTSPFIINNEGYGMISFFNFPIEAHICIELDLKVYLQGVYKPNTDSMENGLYQRGLLPGQIPTNVNAPPTPAGQPYHTSPWNYSGTEGENWTNNDYPDNAIDWLLVSFRTNINSNSEITQTAALLLHDGQIHFPDRCTLPLPDDTDSLYILIQHHNHMGIMSPAPVHFVNASLTYDFTITNSYRDNTSYGQINIGSKWAMYAADANQNEIPSYDINGIDKSLWDNDNGIFDRYLPSDFDLNGDVNGADKFLWNQNNGISSRVPK